MQKVEGSSPFSRSHETRWKSAGFFGLLMQLCDAAGIEVPPSLAEADLLTPYGVALRYGARSQGTLGRADALALAADAVAWARGIIGR